MNTKQLKVLILAAVAGVLWANLASAQVVRNAKEAVDNRQAIAVGRAQLERDIEELAAFRQALERFETAFTNKELAKVRSIKLNLLADMRREILQSERKIAQDRKEVRESSSELNASRREARRSGKDVVTRLNKGRQAVEFADDQRDKRDDRRDVSDDKSDLKRQIARTQRQKQILAILETYTFSFQPNVAKEAIANKALLSEFVQTMQADIAATRLELSEDKGEQREDRRERREDRILGHR